LLITHSTQRLCHHYAHRLFGHHHLHIISYPLVMSLLVFACRAP
jgi:hypothetical protein